MVPEAKDRKTKITKTIICSYRRKIERLYAERLRIYNLYNYENQLKLEGYSLVAGIDEAGRGSLSGPVVAAAVILPCRLFIPYIKDSKKLSSQKRTELYYSILSKAKDVGIGVIEAKIIDRINIAQASFLAMKKAILDLKEVPDYLLVDGFKIPHLNIFQIPLIKGEDRSISIAAASIVAKVYRDNIMIQYDQKYPQYLFKKNKGYGTKEHLEALLKYGPSEIHRKSYKGVMVI
ncbi:ribonuclease HII [Candidatus Atribacteria bacterium RBG_19FT_COMBO_35_14]|uniref:Ribonuclease HII n=1 Tax=Candidatus Sediminicultor quintus TaxID=1797291 RepID=A0A1F5A8T4_9BACT|nr:MAG: ribonuclease HII [Candidatus Atribacteria bacterium RBG_19FT_COMBO_35_14]